VPDNPLLVPSHLARAFTRGLEAAGIPTSIKEGKLDVHGARTYTNTINRSGPSSGLPISFQQPKKVGTKENRILRRWRGMRDEMMVGETGFESIHDLYSVADTVTTKNDKTVQSTSYPSHIAQVTKILGSAKTTFRKQPTTPNNHSNLPTSVQQNWSGIIEADPNLRTVVVCWQSLPEEVKTTILVLVKSTHRGVGSDNMPLGDQNDKI